MHGIDTCTIAIVMTNYFKPGELPGGRTQRSRTDVATWQEVWDTAEFVYQQCVEQEEVAGWDATGEPWSPGKVGYRGDKTDEMDSDVLDAGDKHGIGVFFWSTGSLEEITVESDYQFSASVPRNDSILTA